MQPKLAIAGDRSAKTATKFYRLSHLRKLRNSEQVAAVCYRISSQGIEFLLVRTGGRRWTFPKGSAEPGLTHAQAAALEAFEEAGVHGRMEETSFASYFRPRSGGKRRAAAKFTGNKLAVHAHLCEVSRRQAPQEPKRNPKWFSTAKAKRRLQEDRPGDEGSELARVVDRAVTRIQRLHGESSAATAVLEQGAPQADALQKVQFEASAGTRYSAAIELALHAQLCEVMQLGADGSETESIRFSTVRAKRTLRRVPVAPADLVRAVERLLPDCKLDGHEKAHASAKRNGVVIEIDKKLTR